MRRSLRHQDQATLDAIVTQFQSVQLLPECPPKLRTAEAALAAARRSLPDEYDEVLGLFGLTAVTEPERVAAIAQMFARLARFQPDAIAEWFAGIVDAAIVASDEETGPTLAALLAEAMFELAITTLTSVDTALADGDAGEVLIILDDPESTPRGAVPDDASTLLSNTPGTERDMFAVVHDLRRGWFDAIQLDLLMVSWSAAQSAAALGRWIDVEAGNASEAARVSATALEWAIAVAENAGPEAALSAAEELTLMTIQAVMCASKAGDPHLTVRIAVLRQLRTAMQQHLAESDGLTIAAILDLVDTSARQLGADDPLVVAWRES